MAVSAPSGTNTFVPSFDASGQLVISYSRNPADFKVMQYVTLVPVKKSTGYYLRLTPENAARILNTDGAEFVWHDGHDAPHGEYNTEVFEYQQFDTKRYSFPFRVGYKAEEQADWKVLAQYAAMVAQQAMTYRSLQVSTIINTAANYAPGHSDTGSNWGVAGGATIGQWNAATPQNPIIKAALNAMAQKIQVATLGVVQPSDLVLVVSPFVASKMANTQEIHTYLKESPVAMRVIENQAENPNVAWGLPPTLYGYKVVVEDAVRVSSLKGAAALTSGYVANNDQAALIARKGGLTGTQGGPSWSFCHIFSYEEMTVESRDDPDNRRHQGRVVEDYDVRVVSPISGALATDIFA